MKIVAVVGTGSGCGKTTVACRILREIPGLGAVKISPREGAIRIEWGAGETGKDTDLYVMSGAVPVARVIGPREEVTQAWESIKGKFEGCQGVVIEGASAVELPGERFVIFVVGNTCYDKISEKNREVMALSDLIIDRSSHLNAESSLDKIRTFLAGSSNEST